MVSMRPSVRRMPGLVRSHKSFFMLHRVKTVVSLRMRHPILPPAITPGSIGGDREETITGQHRHKALLLRKEAA